MEQLYLFADEKEVRLEREVKRLQAQVESVRKGLYAKLGHMNKLYSELSYELETYKSAICKKN